MGADSQRIKLNPNSKRIFDQLIRDANEQGLVLLIGSGINDEGNCQG
jgi:hypothetical protein